MYQHGYCLFLLIVTGRYFNLLAIGEVAVIVWKMMNLQISFEALSLSSPSRHGTVFFISTCVFELITLTYAVSVFPLHFL